MAMTTTDTTELLSAGLYWLDDVRRLAGVPTELSRTFIRQCKGRWGLWGGGEQRLGRYYYATFRDLIELRHVNALHLAGVSWQHIGRTAKYAGARLGTDYPFSHRRFRTDGAEIFDLTDTAPDTGPYAIFNFGPEQDAENEQLTFAEIITPSLFESLDYADDVPVRWYPAEEWGLDSVGRSVVVDPLRSFGAPVIEGWHIPTETLYRNFVGEEYSARQVALSYDISEAAVLEAVAFEKELARRAAHFAK